MWRCVVSAVAVLSTATVDETEMTTGPMACSKPLPSASASKLMSFDARIPTCTFLI